MRNLKNGKKMNEDDDKKLHGDLSDAPSPSSESSRFDLTMEFSRETIVGEIPTREGPYLEIIGYGGTRKAIELGEKELFIGRSPECEIKLSIGNVSRKHARVMFHNEEYYIEDLDSTNGTYVNGVKIARCVLRNRDQIDIGGARIIFRE